MLYSHLFTKSRKTEPKDEVTVNAKLLVQAGMVNKTMAGVYSYLPLGLRVIKKIENVVRQQMNAIGGQEVLMPALHPKAPWKKSGGWDKIEVLFKIKSRTEKDYALGQSHEEIVTPLVKEYVSSYRDLPVAPYQIQSKYRDELRAKSGILRGREFLMKDMYSFHLDQADFERFYNEVKKAYFKIFKKVGLVAKSTEASGGGFTDKISYEFMVLTSAGEDEILYCPACEFCVNLEIAKARKGDKCQRCKKGKLKQATASEVGNVFDLGQRYSKIFDFYVLDKQGKKVYPFMGCYGIGISRLMGVIVEKNSDENGIVWPQSVSPFEAHLISIGGPEEKQKASAVYQELEKQGIEVLWDDRDESVGVKLSVADLIGNPYRLVVSKKTGAKIEFKRRAEKKTKIMTTAQVAQVIKSNRV